MKKSTTLTIRLAPELRNRLLSEMEATGRTADAVVTTALSEHLSQREDTRSLGSWFRISNWKDAWDRYLASGNVSRSAPARGRTGGDG